MSLPTIHPPTNCNKPLRPVVSCLVKIADEILILQRSQKVGSFQGYWSCVSGYLEEGEVPLQTAFREISEEIKLRPPVIRNTNSAGPYYSETKDVVFESHWFLFESDTKEISLDWEHDDHKWISPNELARHRAVPWLPNLLTALL